MIIKLDQTKFKRRLWFNAFYRNMKHYYEVVSKGQDASEAKQKYVFYGIKYLGVWTKGFSRIVPTYSDEELERSFLFYSEILDSLTTITPRQFMTMFPVGKEYEGKRWEVMDYYTTIAMIEENGMDDPIEQPFEFLWDYWNWDTRRFLMNYLSVGSEMHKRKTGTTPIEEFLKGERNG